MDKKLKRAYAVVEFPEENSSVSVVPSSWLRSTDTGFVCKWPEKNFKKYSMNLVDPTNEWADFKAVPIHFSRSYKNANMYLKKYLHNSEVDFSSDSASAKHITLIESSPTENCCSCKGPTISDFNRLEAKVDLILKNLQEMQADSIINREMIINLKKNMGVNELELTVQKFKCLKNLEDLVEFEEKLNSADEFAKAMKSCGCLGGRDYKDATRRILQITLSHDLALNLSWSSTNGKTSIRKFKNMLLFINAAVRSNKEYKEITQNDIEEVIKRWLRYASDRMGGRIERMKKSISSS